jgi:SanA protein
MRRHILAAGIPPEDVFLDHAGFSTYQTMYRARDVFGVETAIVVTQRFHIARAVYTARRLGINAWGYEADRRRYPAARRNAIREALARCKAAAELRVLKPRPRYLGKPHPITGSGLSTWDEEMPEKND